MRWLLVGSVLLSLLFLVGCDDCPPSIPGIINVDCFDWYDDDDSADPEEADEEPPFAEGTRGREIFDFLKPGPDGSEVVWQALGRTDDHETFCGLDAGGRLRCLAGWLPETQSYTRFAPGHGLPALRRGDVVFNWAGERVDGVRGQFDHVVGSMDVGCAADPNGVSCWADGATYRLPGAAFETIGLVGRTLCGLARDGEAACLLVDGSEAPPAPERFARAELYELQAFGDRWCTVNEYGVACHRDGEPLDWVEGATFVGGSPTTVCAGAPQERLWCASAGPFAETEIVTSRVESMAVAEGFVATLSPSGTVRLFALPEELRVDL